MMAQGSATRLSPGTWYRTKAVWPMVGTPMIRRITDHLYRPQGFTDIAIKTALFQGQIKQQFDRAITPIPEGMKVEFCLGEETDNYLKKTNTAAGALLAYKQRWNISSMASLAGVPNSSALRDIAGIKYKELKAKLKKGPLSDADRKELDTLVKAAADFVCTIKPLHPSNAAAKPFLVTGVDALTTADVDALAAFYLDKSSKPHHAEALGAILIKEFPRGAQEAVTNYGVVLMKDPVVTGFEEKSDRPKAHHTPLNDGTTKVSFLVNPQLYYFDPAVLAVVELLENNGETTGFSPDWGNDILPILAKSGQLLGKIMGENEYWNDVGDYGTFLDTTQDILRGSVKIPINGTLWGKGGGWNAGANLEGDPCFEGNLYLGPGAKIARTAQIKNSVIEAGAEVAGQVEGSVIFGAAVIPPQAKIINSIVHEGVILPPVPLKVENQVLIAHDEIILSTDIPYDYDGGIKRPKNAKPGAPVRANFPNI